MVSLDGKRIGRVGEWGRGVEIVDELKVGDSEGREE